MRLERLVVHEGETLLDGATGPPSACRPAPTASPPAGSSRGSATSAGCASTSPATPPSAELFASARRPVRRRIPVPAALALAEAGVPTLVVLDTDR